MCASFVRRRDRLALRFALGDLEIALYDRPGRFLSDEALAALVEDLRAVARVAQGSRALPDYGALRGDRADLSRRILTVAYERASGRPVGFNALAVLDVPVGVTALTVVHLGLIFVEQSWQKRQLPSLLYGLTTFLLFFNTGMRAFWVSNVTQVPAIAGMTACYYDRVFPTHLPRGRQTFTHLVLARGIMRHYRDAFGVGEDAGFDESTQVITNAYTGGSDPLKKSWEDAPKHRDARCNAMMARALDYERGDDVLQLGLCHVGTMVRFVSTQARAGGAGALLWQALSLVVAGTLVPVVRWLVQDEVNAQNRGRNA